jgi:hypothetical protein
MLKESNDPLAVMLPDVALQRQTILFGTHSPLFDGGEEVRILIVTEPIR